ncbi:MAG: hypothetical protein J6Y35_02875 [Bacteroidales bacterium]|nr:hypothetical protein [Bacteroidales bacterium]
MGTYNLVCVLSPLRGYYLVVTLHSCRGLTSTFVFCDPYGAAPYAEPCKGDRLQPRV